MDALRPGEVSRPLKIQHGTEGGAMGADDHRPVPLCRQDVRQGGDVPFLDGTQALPAGLVPVEICPALPEQLPDVSPYQYLIKIQSE